MRLEKVLLPAFRQWSELFMIDNSLVSLMEYYRNGQKDLHPVFVDLEKADDTLQRRTVCVS